MSDVEAREMRLADARQFAQRPRMRTASTQMEEAVGHVAWLLAERDVLAARVTELETALREAENFLVRVEAFHANLPQNFPSEWAEVLAFVRTALAGSSPDSTEHVHDWKCAPGCPRGFRDGAIPPRDAPPSGSARSEHGSVKGEADDA